MTGPGQQIVFDRAVYSHEDAYKDGNRMESIEDMVAYAKSEIVTRSAMHTQDHYAIRLQVTVDDIEPGRVYDPDLKAYGEPLEPNLGPCAADEAGRMFFVDEKRSSTASSVGFALSYACVFLFGVLLSYGLDFKTPAGEILAMTEQELEVDIDYYRGMLHNAAGSGCQLSIEQFRRYHALDDELERRANP